jgi:hypothetical protein
MTKKIKNILFKTTLKGRGIVNFDGGEQKFIWNQLDGVQHMNHKNVSYGKKNIYIEDGKKTYKTKLSSNTMKHEIFIDDFPFQSPNVINDKTLQLITKATPASILRGYMFADTNNTTKTKSPICITDSEQTNDAVSHMEFFSKSSPKVTDENQPDNTLFFKETIGYIEYENEGAVDMSGIQFMSTDQLYDRLALNPDDFEMFKKFLSQKMPTFDSTLKYYHKKGCEDRNEPEYGIFFSNDDVKFLVKMFFENLLKVFIQRSNGYAKVTGIKIKYVYDVIEDTLFDDENWIDINSKDDINSIDFEMENFYTEETDIEKAKKMRADYERKALARIEKNRRKKEEEKGNTKKNK